MIFSRTLKKTSRHIAKIPEALSKATVDTAPGFGAAIFTQVIVKETSRGECIETETAAFTFRKTPLHRSLEFPKKHREKLLGYACWLFGYDVASQSDSDMRADLLMKLSGVLTDLFGQYDRVDIRFVRNGTMITVVEVVDRKTGKQLVRIDKPI